MKNQFKIVARCTNGKETCTLFSRVEDFVNAYSKLKAHLNYAKEYIIWFDDKIIEDGLNMEVIDEPSKRTFVWRIR